MISFNIWYNDYKMRINYKFPYYTIIGLRKCIFAFFLISFIISLSETCFAKVLLEVEYPVIPGSSPITSTTPLTEYVQYLFNFGMLIGILTAFASLIFGGFIYITSAVAPEKKKDAKNRIFSSILGMVFLLLAYLILVTINPELSIFKTQDLKTVPGVYLKGAQDRVELIWCHSKNLGNFSQIEYVCDPGSLPTILVSFYSESGCGKLNSTIEMDCGQTVSIPSPTPKSISWVKRTAGVYLYEKSNCPLSEYLSGLPVSPFTSSVSDFGGLKNQIRSVKIINDQSLYLWYIAVLYDLPNYEGKCYYVNPNASCDNLNRPPTEPFSALASSASIYRFSDTPEGNGVTFYRKPSVNMTDFNETGGKLTITNAEIKNYMTANNTAAYVGDLNELKFNNVPKEEQDCTKWDLINGLPENNYCTEWKPPSLSGENLSSIKIDGNYFVMLVHYDPAHDAPSGKWSYCQGFPVNDDINKEGPRQIRWKYIRRSEKYPNYVLIFPVKGK